MYTFALAGANFRPAKAKLAVHALVVGSPLTFEREPENRYDPLAIRVLSDGNFIGFVPKEVNPEISQLLDLQPELDWKIEVVQENGLKPVIQASYVDRAGQRSS